MSSAVRHNPALHRFELDIGGHTAIAVYRLADGVMTFTHTEVPPADEGKGYASTLVKEALDDTRRRGFRIVPACSFVVASC